MFITILIYQFNYLIKKYMTTKEINQADIQQFVMNNIICNQTSLIEELTAREIPWFELDNLENAYVPCDECESCLVNEECEEPVFAHVLEWWSVNEWMANKLEEKKEAVLRNEYGIWWGRTCSGQAISMDKVIEDIYMDCSLPF